MNRKLLALAVSAALAAPLAAQAAPTVYGQLNLSVDMVDYEDDNEKADQWEVNSNSSRIGVKGEEALGNGYSAVYKIEYGVGADDGVSSSTNINTTTSRAFIDSNGDVVIVDDTDTDTDTSVLSSRDVYLGLKGNWGTVKLGRYDSPLKTSQGGVDQFNDMTYTDMDNIVRGENRLSNSIGYESPKIADAITVKVTLQPGETTDGDDGPADAISASVAYEAGGLYAALAVDQGSDEGSQLGEDTIRLTATYTMDALQVGGMFQTSELSGGPVDGEEQSILLSAAYTAGKNVFKGQFIMSTEEDLGAEDEDTTMIAVGMDHNFTQTTKAFAQLGLGQVDNVDGVDGNDGDLTVLTVGMQTKF